MTSEQFIYWMQGFAELNHEPPSPEQWQAIRDHLNLVFDKKTPNYSPGIIKECDRHEMKPAWGVPYVQTSGLHPNWGATLTC